METAPILSVIIPTKNRAMYAIPTIEGILAWDRSDVEVVVQDSSNNDDLRVAAERIGDRRLKYYRSPPGLDMEANFSEATKNSRGRYCAFIGDDDGVTEDAVELTQWASRNGLQAVFPSAVARYLWPDVRSGTYGKRFSAALRLEPFRGEISYPDPEEEVRKCARSAGQAFHRLPRAYFGIVRRDCLDEIFRRCGTYFPGPTPDLSGAVAIAVVATKIVAIDYPIFIQGTGARSSGGLGVAKRHVGNLEDWPHLPQWSIRRWSTLVPRLYLGQTIWAEDLVQSLDAMNRSDLLVEFDAPLLYAMCLCFHPAYASEIMRKVFQHWPSGPTRSVTWAARFATGYVFAWWLRLVSLARNVGALTSISREIVIFGLRDSHEAMAALSARLSREKVQLSRLLSDHENGDATRNT